MKIEVLVTLKGNIGEMFYKGDLFTSPNIPQTIMEELGSNRGLVRVVEDLVHDDIPAVALPIPLLKQKLSRIKR
jgi:hypothetical protein